MKFRSQAFAIVLTAMGLYGFSADRNPGGPALLGGGRDSSSVAKTNSPAAEPHSCLLDDDIVDLHGEVFNPEAYKVAKWDTNDLNIYHLDMTRFRDTLHYSLQDPASGHEFVMPVPGLMTSGFGYRSLFGRKFHKGVDLDLEIGDEVHAAMGGVIRIARYNRGYGNFVVIAHDGGLETLYGHMSALKVEEGQEVKAGDLIGLGGSTGQSTGPHLHLEVRVFGEAVDPSRIIGLEHNSKIPESVTVDASWFDYILGSQGVSYHIVQEGESLQSLAAMYEMAPEDILRLNNLRSAEDLIPGMRLRLD